MRSISPLGMAKRYVVSLATVGLLAAGFAAPAFADETMAASSTGVCSSIIDVATRPNVTNSACVVGKDHVLLEAGYQGGKANGVTGWTYPLADVRVGTNIKNLEVQIYAPNDTHFKSNGVVGSSGLSDSAIGAKYFLGQTKRYAHSIQATLNLPTGDGTTHSNSSTYSYEGEYRFNKILSAGGQLAATANSITGGSTTTRYGSFSPSVTVSAAVPKVATAFVEGATYSKPGGNGTSANAFQGGLKKVLFNNRALVHAEYLSRSDRTTGLPTTTTHGFGVGAAVYLK